MWPTIIALSTGHKGIGAGHRLALLNRSLCLSCTRILAKIFFTSLKLFCLYLMNAEVAGPRSFFR